jgi:hypothetical protein
MLFRNPFRFGKPMPWTPSGETQAVWSIDKDKNILSLSGFCADVIDHADTYNQLWFSYTTMDSDEGKVKLRQVWCRVLRTFQASQAEKLPLTESLLGAAAVSLSFGLNHKIDPYEKDLLLHDFIAYLAIVLADEQETLTQYIPSDLLDESRSSDERVFGKPVWDFQYPDASIFTTRGGFVGCAISTTEPADVVFIAQGSTYPMILRPIDVGGEKRHMIRGFAYVNGFMDSERAGPDTTTFQIQ